MPDALTRYRTVTETPTRVTGPKSLILLHDSSVEPLFPTLQHFRAVKTRDLTNSKKDDDLQYLD